MITLEKRKRIKADSIIIDGFWGCGKSLLYNLLPAFRNTLRTKFLPELEWIYIIRNFKQIDKLNSLAFLNTSLDNSIYKAFIGRETNLRWNDDSGLKNSDKKIQDIALLFSPEGDSVVDEIEKNNIAQCLWTHNISLCNNSIKELSNKQMYFMKLIRNPIFIINNYKNFLKRFESSKEFTPSYYKDSFKLPWFTAGYEDNICSNNYIEKAVICVTNSYENYFRYRDDYKKTLNFQEICLEELIVNPYQIIHNIENFLERPVDNKRIKRLLKKNKIPRDQILNGKQSGSEKLSLKIFKQPVHKNDNEFCSYLLNSIEEKISKDLFKRFINVINKYQKLFPSFEYKY